jgi:hypothetical protein
MLHVGHTVRYLSAFGLAFGGALGVHLLTGGFRDRPALRALSAAAALIGLLAGLLLAAPSS